MHDDTNQPTRTSELVPLLYGYRARLHDLQDAQRAGVRVSGGLGIRIQIASAFQQLIEDRILALAAIDLDAAQGIYDELRMSRDAGIAVFAERLKASLDTHRS
jgi:hypothetical protein